MIESLPRGTIPQPLNTVWCFVVLVSLRGQRNKISTQKQAIWLNKKKKIEQALVV